MITAASNVKNGATALEDVDKLLGRVRVFRYCSALRDGQLSDEGLGAAREHGDLGLTRRSHGRRRRSQLHDRGLGADVPAGGGGGVSLWGDDARGACPREEGACAIKCEGPWRLRHP